MPAEIIIIALKIPTSISSERSRDFMSGRSPKINPEIHLNHMGKDNAKRIL